MLRFATVRTFETAHEAPRTYDVAAWRLDRPHRDLNFHNINSAAQADILAPPTCLVTNEESPKDVVDENEFFKQQ
jgi:ribosomal 30S subunit maturation factor RimM